MTSQDAAAEHLSRSLELLWGSETRSKPGPKPAFTLDQIVDAAITVAGAEGIDALAMRRVAEELGTGAMSLYRYVPGKAELLNLMLDRVHVTSRELIVATGATWREVTELHARLSWQRYLDHPWLLQVNWSRPVLGPNMVADFDVSIAALRDLGLDDGTRVMITDVVDGYVTGVARRLVLSRTASQDSGITDEDLQDRMAPVLREALHTGNYPAVAELGEGALQSGWQETFDFGLARLLDGLEAYINGRQ